MRETALSQSHTHARESETNPNLHSSCLVTDAVRRQAARSSSPLAIILAVRNKDEAHSAYLAACRAFPEFNTKRSFGGLGADEKGAGSAEDPRRKGGLRVES